MVVNAKFVGAIIGQNGSIIREISQETKAKCIGLWTIFDVYF